MEKIYLIFRHLNNGLKAQWLNGNSEWRGEEAVWKKVLVREPQREVVTHVL